MFQSSVIEEAFFWGCVYAGIGLCVAVPWVIVELTRIRKSFDRIATALEQRQAD